MRAGAEIRGAVEQVKRQSDQTERFGVGSQGIKGLLLSPLSSLLISVPRKVDVRLPGKGSSNPISVAGHERAAPELPRDKHRLRWRQGQLVTRQTDQTERFGVSLISLTFDQFDRSQGMKGLLLNFLGTNTDFEGGKANWAKVEIPIGGPLEGSNPPRAWLTVLEKSTCLSPGQASLSTGRGRA